MLKKIITYFLLTVTAAVFALYFYFVSGLKAQGEVKEVCSNISVTISDSMINRFVSPNEVRNIMINSESNPIGKHPSNVNIYHLEELLKRRSAIKESDVSVDRKGNIRVTVTQRKPVLRIQNVHGGFYVDDSQYIFPLEHTFTSYVPIVSGNIPVKIEEGYRGSLKKEDSKWLKDIIAFGKYIDKNPFWSAQIQQINIEDNGDVNLFTRVGDQTIMFGDLSDIPYKFEKLDAFYHDIVPVYGWNRYSSINLKFSDQIVCKLKTQNKK